ncbi:MAG: hypothetical protein AAGF07_01680 [Patescibacteria group bacterium]
MSNILFVDFNGVRSYDDYWKSLAYENHPLHQYKLPIENLLFCEKKDLVKQWMLGKLSSEQIHQIISDELGVPYQELFAIFEKDCRNIDISEKVLAKVEELKSKYYCILSTGNMDCFDRFTLPSNPQLTKIFDEIDNSHNLGILKSTNNGEYFMNKAKSLKVNIHNCVVIDDSVKVCKVFEELGGLAINAYGEEEVLASLNKLA